MKKTKIIVPALAVLLLSTAASVSGTVAWFSMNNSVKVEGMTVSTKVSSNLQIAEINRETNYGDSIEQVRNAVLEPASSYNGFGFYYTTKAKGDGSAIAQGEGGATTFTQYNETASADPSNALGATDGESDASDATLTGKTNYNIGFNTAYGFSGYNATANTNRGSGTDVVCFAYVDYSFYIKATSSKADQVLYMSKCNLLYNDLPISSTSGYAGFAWRVAMFATTADANADVTDDTAIGSSGANLKTILDFGDDSKNQNEIEAVSFKSGETIAANTYYDNPQLKGDTLAAGTASAAAVYYKAASGETAPKAVSGAAATAKTAVTNPGAAAQINRAAKLGAGDTQRYKVVVRLWLEGEDVSCTSTTYANLTEDWKLELKFELGNENNGAQTPVDNGVAVIGSEVLAD